MPDTTTNTLRFPIAVTLTALLATAAGAEAGVVEWNTNSNGFWNQGPRWTGGVVPGPLDDVVISRPDADPLVQIFDGPYTINSLLVDDRLTFLNGSNLTVSNGVNLNGPIFMFGNSQFTVNGAANLNGAFTMNETSTLTIGSIANLVGTLNVNEGSVLDNLGVVNINSDLNMFGGTLRGGQFNLNPGGSLSFSGSTLDGVTINGDTSIESVTIRNGLTFNGTSTAVFPNNRITFAGGAQSFSSGTIEMAFANPGDQRIFLTEGTELTIDASATIRGGQVRFVDENVDPMMPSRLINNGLISAFVANETLSVVPGDLVNNGVMEAINGATLAIGAASPNEIWTSPGTLRVVNSNLVINGRADLSSVQWDRTGGTVLINGNAVLENTGNTFEINASTGTFDVMGEINGGTLRLLDGETINARGAHLRDVIVDGDLSLTGAGTGFSVSGTTELNGLVIVDGEDFGVGAESGTPISGSGELRFLPSNMTAVPDRFLSTTGGGTLIIDSGFTVSGGGAEIGSRLDDGNQLINNGTIVADIPGKVLRLNAGSFINNGLLHVNGGNISVESVESGAVSTNAGSILVEDGEFEILGAFQQAGGDITLTGGLVLLSGDLLNQDSTLTLDGPNALWTVGGGGTIQGGTVEVLNGARLNGSDGTLDAVAFLGDLESSEPGGRINLINGTSVSGDIIVNANSAAVGYPGLQTIDNETFFLDPGFGDTNIDIGTHLTLGPGVVVEGAGGGFGETGNAGPETLINMGLVSANQPGAPLFTQSNGITINQGVMEARNGGSLRMDGDWSNTGVLRVDGGTIQLDGQFTEGDIGTIDRAGPGEIQVTGFFQNSGNTLDLAAGVGPIVLNGGQIGGGTLNLDSPGLLGFSTNTENSISNLTINGDVEMNGVGDFLNVDGNLTHNGSFNLTEPGAQVTFRFNSTYSGGTVVFDGGEGDRTRFGPTSDDPRTLTLDADVLVRGGNGRLGVDTLGNPITAGQGSNTRVINNGVISADVDGQSIQIAVDRFVNNGRVQTVNGGSLEFLSPVFVDPAQNHGTFSITGDTSITSPGELINQPAGEIEFNLDTTGAGLVMFEEQITLGGQLTINYTGGLDTQMSHAYDVIVSDSITGSFDTISLPGDTSEFEFDLVFATDVVRLLLTPFDPAADPLWQIDNLGRLGDGGVAGSLTPLSVPAPSTLALLSVAGLIRSRRKLSK